MTTAKANKKELAIKLRLKGYSYSEISKHPTVLLPKATISTWCSGLKLSPKARLRLDKRKHEKLALAQKNSALSSRKRKLERKSAAYSRAGGFEDLLADSKVKRIILGTLYLAEGTKGDRSSVTFGNSDPEIIRLYLELLRSVFILDESKFRCTIQVRNDQDIRALEEFWSDLTKIPLNQFYAARIDSRSKGKKTRKASYKGVCRLDYLSTELLYEIIAIGRILTTNKGL